MASVNGTPYEIDDTLLSRLKAIAQRVSTMRSNGTSSQEVLGRLRRFFKIKNIYNSNAIEGNSLFGADQGHQRCVMSLCRIVRVSSVSIDLWPASGIGSFFRASAPMRL
jgi:hypothetical protein